MGDGLTPSPTAFTTRTALLTWLLEVLLTLLNRPLALKGRGVHAGAPAIRRGTGRVAVAIHGGPGLVVREPAGALRIVADLALDSSVAADLMLDPVAADLALDPSIATDQAVVTVTATVRHVRPVAVITVVGLIGVVTVIVVEAVAVVVVPVSIVIVVIAVPVDGVPGDVSVVVVVDVSPTTSTAPVHSPCSKTPAASEATANKAASASTNGSANRDPGAKGHAGCNGDGRCVGRHHQGRAINHCRIVLRNVHYVAGGGFDDDGLRGLLHHLDLR